MTKDEALTLALEALKIWEQMYPKSSASAYRAPAITAIKEALAQPEQEPVAREQFHEHMAGSFYTPPPQRTWVGLTLDERIELAQDVDWAIGAYCEYAEKIEAKLKEKNA